MSNINQTIQEGFFTWAERSPAAPALDLHGSVFSYAELADHARKIATAVGVTSQRIGILGDKSAGTYAAILACLYSGNAFVPLDPAQPLSRLKKIFADADLDKILHATKLRSKALEISADLVDFDHCQRLSPLPAPLNLNPGSLAYLLYTSGSTGDPKGVPIRHENACAFLRWCESYFSFAPGERFSAHAELSFDLSIFDMFACWSSGGCLVPLSNPTDKIFTGKFIQSNKITVWLSVPSVLTQLRRLGHLSSRELGSLKYMLFAGESPSPHLLKELRSEMPKLRIFNLYGPTESTVACACWEVKEEFERIPIGWNTGDTSISLLSDNGKEVPSGEIGEIYVTGPQVASGYWKNPAESEKRFLPFPPIPGQKSFRTGDFALHTEAGPVFIGRQDQQMKFRGYRIEIGEVEAALLALESVIDCAVTIKRAADAADEMTAFLQVSEPDLPADVCRKLRETLPSYMIPTEIRFVGAIPRTPNGKIDRERVSALALEPA